MTDDLREQWQSQPQEEGKMSVEEIRFEAQRLHDRWRRRNIREYFAAVITALIFALQILLINFPGRIRVALVLFILGLLVFLYQLRKRAAPRALSANLGLPCLDFHRQELERQRDALQGFWLWVVPPFVPGAVVLIISIAFGPRPQGLITASIVTAFFALMFTFWAKVNQRAARRLQRRIDELHG
jgi:Mn2+/Fe2+ NRAMP family transporter